MLLFIERLLLLLFGRILTGGSTLLFLDRLLLLLLFGRRLTGGSMLLLRLAKRGFGFVVAMMLVSVAATSGRWTSSAKGRTFKKMCFSIYVKRKIFLKEPEIV